MKPLRDSSFSGERREPSRAQIRAAAEARRYQDEVFEAVKAALAKSGSRPVATSEVRAELSPKRQKEPEYRLRRIGLAALVMAGRVRVVGHGAGNRYLMPLTIVPAPTKVATISKETLNVVLVAAVGAQTKTGCANEASVRQELADVLSRASVPNVPEVLRSLKERGYLTQDGAPAAAYLLTPKGRRRCERVYWSVRDAS